MSPPVRLYVWVVECRPTDRGPDVGGAFARCYVPCSDHEASLRYAAGWIVEAGYGMIGEPELLAVWEPGVTPQDPDEAARVAEAWEGMTGSVWFHRWPAPEVNDTTPPTEHAP